ncbi:hypothetical protein MMC07_000292 [Pseudocyphellaria aurata]|nr:hypothetical protein [Pseudocyphellaria aurata]
MEYLSQQHDEPKVLSLGISHKIQGTHEDQVTAGPSSSPLQKFQLRMRRSWHMDSTESARPSGNEPGIYLGSYARRSKMSDWSPQVPTDAGASRSLGEPSPTVGTSHSQLEQLLQNDVVETVTYGVEELRDGFFDASFCRPLPQHEPEGMRKKTGALSEVFHANRSLSFALFLRQQWHGVVGFVKQATISGAGIRLLKSFLGYYIAYLICLTSASKDWLGKYNYVMVISALVNHAGRPVGSQIDGAFMTIFGTIMGLGWGSLALYVSTSTTTARSGYGGVLATFLVCFTATIGWLRCVFIRFYQAVLCAGIAICYTCLADTSQSVGWRKVFDYGVPWVLGQAICLVISILVFPDTGSRSISSAFHSSLNAIRDGLTFPPPESTTLRRDLAWNIVNLSQAVRDFTIDISISRFQPEDVRSLRNLLQGVLRGVMAIRPNTALFETIASKDYAVETDLHMPAEPVGPGQIPSNQSNAGVKIITETLAKPTQILLESTVTCINHLEMAIMSIGRLNNSSGSSTGTTHELSESLEHLRTSMSTFDSADDALIGHPALPQSFAGRPEIVEIFLFVHPIRLVAEKVEAVLDKVLEMQKQRRGWKIHLPSYPWSKSLLRTNAQVRHDRGGLTAGFYFRSKRELDRTMADLHSKVYVPRKRTRDFSTVDKQVSVIGRYEEEGKAALEDRRVSDRVKFRYNLWKLIHRLQGFESRFALKVTAVTALISIPAWLPQSSGWWNSNETWWAVVTVWTMMNPRVGGTFQNLTMRTLCAASGAIWAGLAFAVDGRNPYVFAVFAALFMLPMLQRFTQSSHPRSGIVGCLSFTVVSLSAYTSSGVISIVKFSWTRGLAFVVGVVSALVVNWMLWPFVARHELRKSLSAMLLHSALLYRRVVGKYIYYVDGQEPGPEDIAKSEMLEGRLREGFVRMQQLIELTRHEIRLRGPFDPLPYCGLIDTCERFFEHLVQVRQFSLYFHPNALPSLATDPLLGLRRDAVAVILMNLYILATAMRSSRPVPCYLPSAAAARQRLVQRMEQLEETAVDSADPHGKGGHGRRWADVYRYAFSAALTDIVAELQQLHRFTQQITGEGSFGVED